ncbi:MAG: DUF1015 family protein [Defluviitaleaceae bacterium]|nr:DUF1015 family protein [Defluviitaleaceae bacterium]MCL2836372.1 DUF1015 family protein [Defluviitaleaceae bacterium]
MSDVRPFAALRPTAEFAAKVAALPYDVMSSDEARKMAEGNPYCFLHVTKAEIDLDPSVDHYAPIVYETAAKNLAKLESDGVLVRDPKPCYYIYSQTMNGRTQTGVAAGSSVDEYLDGRIKKHELTREEKEQDRIRHVATTNANTGPVFMTHKPCPAITAFIKNWTAKHEPEYSFTPDDGITHTVWVVDCDDAINELRTLFAGLDALYIADGHHRNASTAKVALRKRAENPGYCPDAPFNYYLSVLFSSDELMIMDYNRVVKNLNGLSEEAYLEAVKKNFEVTPATAPGPVKPAARHSFGMYLNKTWYNLTAKPGLIDESDPVECLDYSILQKHLLAPVLGISDPRTHPDIDFVGGLRGVQALADHVDKDGGVAFSMYPASMEELIAIADAGQIMPPKSTWFEPKLRSGLFVHTLG